MLLMMIIIKVSQSNDSRKYQVSFLCVVDVILLIFSFVKFTKVSMRVGIHHFEFISFRWDDNVSFIGEPTVSWLQNSRHDQICNGGSSI